MITLDQARANIGSPVIYTQPHGVKTEDGVITSVGPQFVFVRYGNDRHSNVETGKVWVSRSLEEVGAS